MSGICSSTRHGWMYWESTANEGPQLRDSLQGLLDETLPIFFIHSLMASIETDV